MKENQNCKCPLWGLASEAVEALTQIAEQRAKQARMKTLQDRAESLMKGIRKECGNLSIGIFDSLLDGIKSVQIKHSSSRISRLASELHDIMQELTDDSKGGSR